jgi:hypothetical protein
MIEVAAAEFSERGVLNNLFQLYVHAAGLEHR